MLLAGVVVELGKGASCSPFGICIIEMMIIGTSVEYHNGKLEGPSGKQVDRAQ